MKRSFERQSLPKNKISMKYNQFHSHNDFESVDTYSIIQLNMSSTNTAYFN